MSLRITTTNPAETGELKVLELGTSSSARLKAAFGSSPIYNNSPALHDDGTLDAPIRETFQRLALDGEPTDGKGFMIVNFNRDFTGPEGQLVPTYAGVEVGAEGKPASAWVPNPSSPADGSEPGVVGSMDARTLPAPPEDFGTVANPQWGSGVDATAESRDPAVSSRKIAASRLGRYELGHSTID
ncbi:MAG TPA: hypothetical protein EYG51_15110 [Pseudomonadales bacterium]|nr:hypothetical protein [Pseudomonadales bacterium]